MTAALYTLPGKNAYSYYQLVSTVTWPADVDPTHREEYLNDLEFQRVIGLPYHRYHQLPRWRKEQLKREVDLF